MTPQEFEYIQRAVKALEDPEMSDMSRAKVLRTMTQITGKAVENIENKLVDKVNNRLYNIHIN